MKRLSSWALIGTSYSINLEAITYAKQTQRLSTYVLTGRLRVEKLLAGNVHTFRTVARMDESAFSRLVNLLPRKKFKPLPNSLWDVVGLAKSRRGQKRPPCQAPVLAACHHVPASTIRHQRPRCQHTDPLPGTPPQPVGHGATQKRQQQWCGSGRISGVAIGSRGGAGSVTLLGAHVGPLKCPPWVGSTHLNTSPLTMWSFVHTIFTNTCMSCEGNGGANFNFKEK